MFLSKQVTAACRKLLTDGVDSITVRLENSEAEIKAIDLSSQGLQLPEYLEQSINDLRSSKIMFVAMYVVWANYITQEMPSDSSVFFLISEREG
jgi:hypothetical protein